MAEDRGTAVAAPAAGQAGSSPAPSREALILADQANSVQGNLKWLIAGNATICVVGAWIMVNPAPAWQVGLWLAVQLGLSVTQGPRVGRRPATPRNAARRLRAHTIGIGIGGALWAVGVVLFWPTGRQDMALLLSVVILGSNTGALLALHAWPPAFYAFFVPCTLSVQVAALMEGGATNIALAITSVTYGFACARFAKHLNGTLTDSLRARYEVAELAADLKVQKERAEEASQAKSRFLAAASHDLRQPVHALSLYVGALRQEPPGPGAERLLDRVEATVGSMGALFNALLDISRLDAGMVVAERRPCALRPLLQRICDEEAVVAAAAGLRLRANLHEARVVTDPVLLERVVRNLLVNALRYTRNGGVLVTLRQRGAEAVVRIVDTGIGIPEARQEEVFQEFVQLHNPERDRHQGLGLGLAIVRRLSELLGIRVGLRSRPGRGSTFTLCLPVGGAVPEAQGRGSGVRPDRAELADHADGAVHTDRTDHADHAHHADHAAPLAAQAQRPQGLVLVVDDDADIRAGMRSLLAGWGFAVREGGGIAELLADLQAVHEVPRLIVSDYRLRGAETGLHVIARLRDEFNEDVPAIVITGDTAPERLREAAAGGHVLLHKPVSAEQLRAAVERVLRVEPGAGAA